MSDDFHRALQSLNLGGHRWLNPANPDPVFDL
jgi:hypothetical protein